MNRVIRAIKMPSLSPAVVKGLAAVFILAALLGVASTALAQEQGLIGHLNLQPLPPVGAHLVVFTDPVAHPVVDREGNVLQGVHTGEVRCLGDNCNKKTQLDLLVGSDRVVYEYQFKSLQALDSEARRSVVVGRGTMDDGLQRAKFLFTATFEDNGDGTVEVTYEASRPDASFRIPTSPGIFAIIGQP